MRRWLLLPLLFLLSLASHSAMAETVSSLPAPTGYVNDFAHVLSPDVIQKVDNLCKAVDQQAHAQIAVVTVQTIDNDQSIEEFSTELEDKWKVGPKGTDRGVLMVLEINPRHGRIEVGYGLEGILNDAKVGDIGRSMVADARAGDYNAAVPLGVQQLASIIAADAGITLQPIAPAPRRQQQQRDTGGSLGPLIFIAIVVAIFFFSAMGRGGRGGRGGGGSGLGWFLLGNVLGGGFGGRRGGGNDWGGGGGGGFDGGGGDGGGFGGFGGGSSGGGGASGDF